MVIKLRERYCNKCGVPIVYKIKGLQLCDNCMAEYSNWKHNCEKLARLGLKYEPFFIDIQKPKIVCNMNNGKIGRPINLIQKLNV